MASTDVQLIDVVAVADLHGRLPRLPATDLLVIAGDVCPGGGGRTQRDWVEKEFALWLERQDADEIIGIAGNWDAIAAADPELMRSLPWTYLENETADVLSLRVFGSPLALPFGAFPFMASEEKLSEVWKQIPDDVDLLVIHGPAYGLGDLTEDDKHVGSRSLLERLDELPRVQALVCGHIHEAAGRGEHGHVQWFNAAMVNREDPFWFELRPSANKVRR